MLDICKKFNIYDTLSLINTCIYSVRYFLLWTRSPRGERKERWWFWRQITV